MIGDTWRLTALEFDALWDALGLDEAPYPLEITSHGETESERRELCRQTLTALGRRWGFGAGPAGSGPVESNLVESDLAVAVTLLARPRYWIDSLWVTDSVARRLLRLLAASDGGKAVLALQLPGNGTGQQGDLVLSEVAESSMVPEVVGALPAERRGAEPSASLPTAALAAHGNPSDAGGDGGFLRRAGADDTRDARALRALRGLLDADHLRGGQVAANARDRMGRKTRSPVVFWFDNPGDGRYLASVRAERGDTDWVTVEPVDYRELVAGLHRALAEVGADPT